MANQKDDPLRPIQDSRGFFMLPRSPAESGYYTYGTMDKKPDKGGYQYPHPIMMQAILRVALVASHRPAPHRHRQHQPGRWFR